MSGFGLGGKLSSMIAAMDESASAGVLVTSASSLNVYGAWTQLIALTPFDVKDVTINSGDFSLSYTAAVFDIGFGAAGAESVAISSLIPQQTAGPGFLSNLRLPFSIPAGTRVSARLKQENGPTPQTIRVGLNLAGGDFDLPAFTAMDLLASAVVPPNSGGSNTKGAWGQLIAATAVDYAALLVGPVFAASSYIADNLYDIGIGTAGSEQTLLSDLWFQYPNMGATPGYAGPFRMPVKAGTRIVARGQTTDPSHRGPMPISLWGMR